MVVDLEARVPAVVLVEAANGTHSKTATARLREKRQGGEMVGFQRRREAGREGCDAAVEVKYEW